MWILGVIVVFVAGVIIFSAIAEQERKFQLDMKMKRSPCLHCGVTGSIEHSGTTSGLGIPPPTRVYHCSSCGKYQ